VTIRRPMILIVAIAPDFAGFVGSFGRQTDWGIFVLLAATVEPVGDGDPGGGTPAGRGRPEPRGDATGAAEGDRIALGRL